MMDIYNSLPGYLSDKNINIDQFMKIVGVSKEAIERYMRWNCFRSSSCSRFDHWYQMYGKSSSRICRSCV